MIKHPEVVKGKTWSEGIHTLDGEWMSQTLSVEREREWLVLLSIWRGENVNTDGVSEKKDNSLNPGSVAVHASCGARLLLPYRLFLRSIDRSRRWVLNFPIFTISKEVENPKPSSWNKQCHYLLIDVCHLTNIGPPAVQHSRTIINP